MPYTRESVPEIRQRAGRMSRRVENIVARADRENRDLTDDESREADDILAEATAMRERADAQKLREQAARDAAGPPAPRPHEREDGGALGSQFRQRVLENSRAPIHVPVPRHPSGMQTREIATDTAGGLVPSSFYDQLLRHLTENSGVLAAGGRLITTETGEPMTFPATTGRSSAEIVPEGGTIPESDPSFNTVTLAAFKYAFLVYVTREIVEDATFDLEGYLAEQSGTSLGNAAGAHFINGTGSGQPTGVLSDATAGVTTDSATLAGDDIIDMAHSLAMPYALQAAWLMNTTTLGAVRKLTDDNGRYLFDTGIQGNAFGQVGTLVNRPVYIDPGLPDVAAGNSPILFGDFSRFYVRQARAMRFERSDQFAFDTDRIAFRGMWRVDGRLADQTGAVKTLTMGGST